MPEVGIIERYQEYLSPVDPEAIISLNEGSTPLIKAELLPEELGIPEVDIFFKFEGLNPTGSFKDRGMTMAMSKAKEDGAEAVICASTGNTSASAAAYAARANIPCAVLIPDGKIAQGKLVQAHRYGANVIMIQGNFDQGLELVKQVAEESPVTIVNSINPYRIEGQKTGAFEVVDDLGDAPEYHAIPVGNAGNITAYWAGYKQYYSAGKSTQLPKMLGFQAAGAAPIVNGAPVENPETIASAIRIGNPASWAGAINARVQSGGLIEAVTDEEIEAAYGFVAAKEGVFAEPASVAPVAGIGKLAKEGYFEPGSRIVVTLTGNGLKDPEYALSFDDTATIVEPTLEQVQAVIRG